MFILLCAPLHIWLKHWRKQVRRCFTPCRSFIIKTLTTVGQRRFEKIMPWSKQWVMSNRRYRLRLKVSGCPVRLPSREVQARFDTWWDVVPQSYRGTLLSFLSRVGVDQWQMGMGHWLHFFKALSTYLPACGSHVIEGWGLLIGVWRTVWPS